MLCIALVSFIASFVGAYFMEKREYAVSLSALFWVLFACLGLLALSIASSIASKIYKLSSLIYLRNMATVFLLIFGGWLANNTWYNYFTFIDDDMVEFTVFQDSEKPNHFVFNGAIEKGAGTHTIRTILNSENLDMDVPISLEINSNGGKPAEAIILSQFIVNYDVAVEVLGKCISACNIVLLSSNHRYVDPRAWIGFHASFNQGKDKKVSYDSSYLNFYDKHLEMLLKRVGASDEFIKQALVEDAFGGFFPNLEELKQAGVVNKNERTYKHAPGMPNYL